MPAFSRAGTLDASLDGWIVNTVQKNHWRVARYIDKADLIQDGYMLYVKCRNRYADTAINQQHFMALFKTTFMNHITSLARERTSGEESLIEDGGPPGIDREWWLSRLMGCDGNAGPAERLRKEARFPINAVIEIFTTEAGISITRRYPQKPWEPLNQYLCRLVGVDHLDYNIPKLIESFIAGRGLYYLHQPV